MAHAPVQFQGPVEARSLAAITALAANPPAYPRNPTQEPLEPLVLYIVRVPGSRDVFLTPLKPPTRSSISAEAINSSLYYLHVSSPEDELVLQDLEQEQGFKPQQGPAEDNGDQRTAAQPEEFARLNKVKRKPVGGASSQSPPPPVPPPHREQVSTAPEEAPGPALPPRPLQTSTMDTGMGATEPFPHMSDESRGSGLPMRSDSVHTIRRRPLPSVPGNDGPPSLITVRDVPKRWSAQPGHLPEQNPTACRESYENSLGGRFSLDASRPVLQNRPSQRRKAFPSRWSRLSPPRGNFETTEERPAPGFHITLIRRDPTHGLQWNVGTISNSAEDNSTIDIEISTPGYGRFAGHNEPLSLEALGFNVSSGNRQRGSSLSSMRPSTSHGSEDRNNASQGRNASKTFHRKLYVSTPPTNRSRHNRDNSGGSVEFSNNGSESPPKPSGPSKLKSGYYTFTSPWNGTCTFSTSINGRSLKCKHMIPGPAATENPATTVAEIRFNIPLTHPHYHLQPNHQSPFSLSQLAALSQREGKRGSLALLLNPNTYRPHSRSLGSDALPQFPRARSQSGSSTDADEKPSPNTPDRDVDDEDRFDLSLARERAGGGLDGKDAKLGKLVIEDEGLKMLDLLIAACMGVWWRAYYHA
ncbi:hypothetical protein AOR_1_330184 [Paecilomyces variotii No. 5]|uniref:Oxidoreductase-like protein n=1 Tax=Byssochlamys spectabilis (strain No. 5 / NBRC 109023) TaxID=1356009 RepID=V5FYR7_BYSSN|nr:hypothetical protein AOR_1_330184 [Paecilomyces variotii No. 5]